MKHTELQLVKQALEYLDEAEGHLDKLPKSAELFGQEKQAGWKISMAKRSLQRLAEGKLSHGIKGPSPRDDAL